MSRAQGIRRWVLAACVVAGLISNAGACVEKQNPGVRVDVQSGGSTRGVTDARAGLENIGMASRALKPEESDLMAHRIAMDGIGIILHRKNPVNALSDGQIKAIFTGKITNWQQLGPGRQTAG